MKTFKNIKSISFKVRFNGKGCVNFDSSEQKFILLAKGFIGGVINNNVKFAKKAFGVDENNNEIFKYKISSDCLRHEIFGEGMPFMTPQVQYIPHILYNAIAQPSSILRGYMFTDTAMKKSGPFMITDAVEVTKGHNKCHLDVHSTSGDKSFTKDDSGENGGTSFYQEENVPNAVYESEGFIDLTELQFISADKTYDRAAVNVDGGPEEDIFLNALKANYNFDPHFGFYANKSSIMGLEWGERGVLLSEDAVDMLVKYALTRVLSINITRKNALLKIARLDIEVNTADGESIKYEDVIDVNDFHFGYWQKYEEVDEETIKSRREEAEQKFAKILEQKKAKKNKNNSKDE